MRDYAPPAVSRLLSASGAILALLLAAACGSSTSTTTAPSPIQRCGVTLSTSSTTVPAAGGTGRIVVSTARECAWTATSEAPWLSITGPASGQGDGAVDYRAAANPDPVVRRGRVVLNDKGTEIEQAAGECVITLRESSASFSQAGGSGSIQVVASSQLCAWTANADADWVVITAGATGSGTAMVAFTVAPTSGPPRTATIRIAGQRFSITQSEGCTYAINPTSQAVPPAGGPASVTVTSAPGCSWTAASNAPWIAITEGASGTGNGTVRFTVAATDGPARAGTLIVAGHTFTVNQGQGCSFALVPSSASVPAAGGAQTFSVQSSGGCAWTATSNVPWISIAEGAAGTGNGTVRIAVAANTGPARTGTVTAGGQMFTINQEGGCAYAINPQQQAVDASGGTAVVGVSAPAGCAWTAVANVAWIVVSSGASGNGNGSVQLTVATSSEAARTGTVTIAGQTFTVTQASGCTFGLDPEAIAVGASGGQAAIQVSAATGCAWTAASNAPWLIVTGGASGSGSGVVQVTIEANSGPARMGNLTIAGRTVPVTQDSGCTYTLSAPGQSIAAAGGSSSVGVVAGAGCPWTAAAQVPWIAITEGASGAGTGAVQFTVQPNTTGAPRTGTIAVAGHTYTVNQEM